jgi:sec-independent protein translocase protein TatA
MFGAPGLTEILIVCFIVLLLFGKRLPGVMRSLGTSIVEFKKGVKGIDDEEERPNSSDESSRR